MELNQLINYILQVNAAPLSTAIQCIDHLQLKPDYPIILVGGTNGKGSVCAYLTTILSLAGYRVGSFTSPHVFKYNERICLNNQPIDDITLTEALTTVIESAKAHCPPSNLGLFQSFTLAAHLIFSQKKIDIAIIEVGIGGRRDITNLFEPTISAITTVDYDHCDILGDTLEEIGIEKSAIFRPNKWAFYGSSNPPQSVIDYATQIGAYLEQYDVHFGCTKHELSFDVWCNNKKYYTLPYPALRGEVQPKNVALALAILNKLNQQFPVSNGTIKTALLATRLNGRFQVMPGLPQIVLDVAHNPQAVTIMLQNMLKLPFVKHSYAVFGVMRDKDATEIIRLCKNSFERWFIAKPKSLRGLSTSKIAVILLQHGVAKQNIVECENISMAVQYANKYLTNDDRLICFGSFLVVEEVFNTIQGSKI